MSAPQEFAYGYVIDFDDNGPTEGQFLHVGSLESCEEIDRIIPAVSYSGDRKMKSSRSFIVPRRDGMDPGRLISIEKHPHP